jgi:D-aminoacyl-tRNA deacylase
MRIVLQRVTHARVTVDGAEVGRIQAGMLLLLAVGKDDTPQKAEYLAEKCAALRIFTDAGGKMNRSCAETGGAALVVSQFTLYGDCKKGRRPSFTDAADPQKARELYEYFVAQMKKHVGTVQAGVFGAMMDVELVNDGPVTLIVEA